MRLLLTLLMSMTMGAYAGLTFDEDRMAVVDGKRTFILGLYENPAEDAVLKAVKSAGFNLVQSSQNISALDRLHQHGLLAWINTGMILDLSEDPAGRKTQIRSMVETLGAHPALAVWEVPDEALWNNWYSAQLYRDAEPRRLREALQDHADKQVVDKVTQQIEEALQLRRRGNFSAAERLMDEAWRMIGQEPARAGFGTGDAAARSETMRAGLVEGYAFLKSLGTPHPVWMNHAPRNQIVQLAGYNAAADIVGCDIYPIPGPPYTGHSDIQDTSASAVGAYTARMQAAAPEKPVWMVLQGFGWADLLENPTEEEIQQRRRPTLAETRFMAWDSIAHGARGILYWGTYTIERDSQLWQDVLQVVKELSDRQAVISAPESNLVLDVTHAESYGSLAWEPIVLPKAAPDGLWLLVVNENPEPIRVDIAGIRGEATRFVDSFDPAQSYEASEGKLSVFVERKGFVLLGPGGD